MLGYLTEGYRAEYGSAVVSCVFVHPVTRGHWLRQPQVKQVAHTLLPDASVTATTPHNPGSCEAAYTLNVVPTVNSSGSLNWPANLGSLQLQLVVY
jgi:hypothetical protein